MIGAIAPWTLAVGLVLSFAADAGQEASFGANLAALTSPGPEEPADLLAASSRTDPGAFGLIRQARLLAAPERAREPAELTPRRDLKAHAVQLQQKGQGAKLLYPAVERARRADPFVALRPAFDTRWRGEGALAAAAAQAVLFAHDDSEPASVFVVEEGEAQGPDAVASFQPFAEAEAPVTGSARAAASPGAGASAATTPQRRDGATPAVPRSAALASSTPVALQSKPVEIAALPRAARAGQANASEAPRSERPDYAALLDPDHVAREKKCLAEAIYFEARSESEAGQAAVAQVVLNRVKSGLYPDSVCGTVYQNRTHRNACQFSFACDGKSLRITEPEPWKIAVRIADAVTLGSTYSAHVGGSTHYHANYVRPRWARRLKKMDVIGAHIFYKLRPGQT